MKQSNLGQENSNTESFNEKDKEDVVFAEDSAINTLRNKEDEDKSTYKKRHGCVTAWFILMLIGSTLGLLINFAVGFYYPHNIFILLSVGQLGCIISMFNWKRAGFWYYAIICIIAAFINMSIGVEIAAIIGGLLSPVILYGILQIEDGGRTSWDQLD